MKKEIRYTIDCINDVARNVISLVEQYPCRVITFYGDLGAGKTTFIRALGDVWGITDTITSPTFAYLNIYHADKEGRASLYHTVYHYDLYRLTSKDDFFSMGLNDYLGEPGTVALIEWPDIIAGLLPAYTAAIYLCHGAHESERCLTLILPTGDTHNGT